MGDKSKVRKESQEERSSVRYLLRAELPHSCSSALGTRPSVGVLAPNNLVGAVPRGGSGAFWSHRRVRYTPVDYVQGYIRKRPN